MVTPTYARLVIGTAHMLLNDLEQHKAGVPIFDRIVDSRGSSLGNPTKWREMVEKMVNDQGVAKAAPEPYKRLLLRWYALNATTTNTADTIQYRGVYAPQEGQGEGGR